MRREGATSSLVFSLFLLPAFVVFGAVWIINVVCNHLFSAERVGLSAIFPTPVGGFNVEDDGGQSDLAAPSLDVFFYSSLLALAVGVALITVVCNLINPSAERDGIPTADPFAGSLGVWGSMGWSSCEQGKRFSAKCLAFLSSLRLNLQSPS